MPPLKFALSAFPRGDVISASRAAVSPTSTSADPASNSGTGSMPTLRAASMTCRTSSRNASASPAEPATARTTSARRIAEGSSSRAPRSASSRAWTQSARAVSERYSHSIVPGGFDVMSRTTRLTSRISLIIREAMRSSRS